MIAIALDLAMQHRVHVDPGIQYWPGIYDMNRLEYACPMSITALQ